MIYLLAFIAAISIIVTVHEFGHYWVAKKLGVKVLRFSVGFGTPLLTKIAGQDRTEYTIAAIPLGGYVKMLDEREGVVAPHEKHRAFNRQPVAKRIAIVVAGPLFNFLFAIAAYWLTFVMGVDGVKPFVGSVTADSIAYYAGVRATDEIIAINDQKVASWQDAVVELLDQSLKTHVVKLDLKRGESDQVAASLDLTATNLLLSEGDVLDKVGIQVWQYEVQPVFGELDQNGVAKHSGLQTGDKIISADEKTIKTWGEWVSYVEGHANTKIEVVIERNGSLQTISLTPILGEKNGKTVGKIGALPLINEEDYRTSIKRMQVKVRYQPLESIPKAIIKTWDISVLTIKLLGKLIVGQASLKNISGPVTIAEYAGMSAAIGISAFVGALAIISVSIGILNLMPVPILDGGHLLYYMVEIIKGSPVSETTEVWGQRIGAVMLAGLMGLAFYNDIHRLLG